jgi:hypothetical protein
MNIAIAHAVGLAVTIALAAPAAAQEGQEGAPPGAAPESASPDYRERFPATLVLEAPERSLVFRRLSPAAVRELGIERVPTPPGYQISIGQYWDCREVTTPFGETGLETCRLTLVVCDDEGNCVEH